MRHQITVNAGILVFTQFVEPTVRMVAGSAGSPEFGRYEMA